MKITGKIGLTVAVGCLCFTITRAQVYTHPTTGLQSTYAGACMVNTCSGSYYDDGGPGGNYSNNIGVGWPIYAGIYRTFCPNTAGMCITATFNWFDVESAMMGCYDFLRVRDGATQGSTSLWAGCGTAAGAPGPFTSSDSSGCLTFEFFSDGSVAWSGWDITLSCTPCAVGQSGTNPNDCSNGVALCGNTSFNGTSNGPGLTSECGGCVVSENYSNWYQFSILTSGTLTMIISPLSGSNDYDFALYQASSCGTITLGSPDRCSYAMGSGNTGLNTTAVDVSEDVSGDSWVQQMNVTAGQNFYLLVNDWTGANSGFNLTWGGTATLDCSIVLPIELLYFTGRAYDKYIELDWETASERNVHHYVIDKYLDDEWVPYFEKPAAGGQSFYAITDTDPLVGDNIYRLRTVDFESREKTFDVVAVKYWPEMFDVSLYQSDNFLTLHTQQPIEDLKLYNTIGQELEIPLTFDRLDPSTYRINISSLPENTYLLRVNNSSNHLFIKYSTR